jgi:Tfp pilus assembly protein PilN
MSDELIKILLQQGPVVGLLLFAIIWLQKSMTTQNEQANNALAKASDSFQKERDARLDAMDEHIRRLESKNEQLEQRSQKCEQDRTLIFHILVENGIKVPIS